MMLKHVLNASNKLYTESDKNATTKLKLVS